LLGTAPHHYLYILLRSQHPPRTFPSRVPSTLQPALQRLVAPWSGLVNFMYTTDLPAPQTALTGPPLDLQEPNPEETYEAFAYAPGRAPLHLPRRYDGPIHLYVCTHGARDCRCGDVGGDVADALRNCATSARTRTPGGIWDRVVVGEVSHVGGHRHAANMLVFPHGEWLGGLQARDLGAGPRVLDRIVESTPSLFDGSEKNPLCPEHWRGRMGLSKADQLHLYE
ncbi:Sucrase/ferredoxin-like-domain-containing protein, partial [Amylostereum chailletii]